MRNFALRSQQMIFMRPVKLTNEPTPQQHTRQHHREQEIPVSKYERQTRKQRKEGCETARTNHNIQIKIPRA